MASPQRAPPARPAPRPSPAGTPTSIGSATCRPIDATLIDEVDRAGLRGRGGAGFPTAVKLAAVKRSAAGTGLARRRRPIVVANGTEGEPLSKKDRVLLVHAPHLVIDGAVAAALAVGADEAVICVDRHRANAVTRRRACPGGARAGRCRPRRRESRRRTPARYVTGEETALVRYLNGGDAKPAFVPPRPFERGVDGRPTLVDNVETLADLALIARFGAPWWRTVGTMDDPGSLLVTASGGVAQPGVYELPFGVQAPVGARARRGRAGRGRARRRLLRHVAGPRGRGHAAPEPGRPPALRRPHRLRHRCCALPTAACPLAELANVAAWLAGESAGPVRPVPLRAARHRRARSLTSPPADGSTTPSTTSAAGCRWSSAAAPARCPTAPPASSPPG